MGKSLKEEGSAVRGAKAKEARKTGK